MVIRHANRFHQEVPKPGSEAGLLDKAVQEIAFREGAMSELAATKLAKELMRKTERTQLSVEALMQSFLDNLCV